MQKFEYLTLIGKLEKNDILVIKFNENDLGSTVSKKTKSYPFLYKYLNELGKEGWEVVSSQPLESEGHSQLNTRFAVIAKRKVK